MSETAATSFLTYDPLTGTITGPGFSPDGTLPPTGAIACSPAQAQGWQNWSVVDGVLTPFTPPSPPTTAQAATQLATRIGNGIAITSTAAPALSATYALDATTLDQIGSVARDSAAGLGLPGGAPSFTYPDATGAPRVFSEAQIIALYKAQRDLLFILNSQAAIMAHGGAPSWPVQAATIA